MPVRLRRRQNLGSAGDRNHDALASLVVGDKQIHSSCEIRLCLLADGQLESRLQDVLEDGPSGPAVLGFVDPAVYRQVPFAGLHVEPAGSAEENKGLILGDIRVCWRRTGTEERVDRNGQDASEDEPKDQLRHITPF